MLANPLFHYSCGHIAHNFALGAAQKTRREKICPECFTGAVIMVAFDCELCGTPAETTASGYKCSQRLLCSNCRKMYNRWDTMARKAKNSQRSFPALHQYIESRNGPPAVDKNSERNPEPPLTTKEFEEIASFGKRTSPCARCEHITCDKNEAPCNQCAKLAALAQTQDKLFLDSLYL